MDPEAKQLLQATLTLAEENNKMLHKIRSVQKRNAFWQIAKIVVIIGIALGAFYFLDPYLDKVIDLYNSITGTVQKVEDVSNVSTLKDLLKKI